jgi:mevalonate kinase
MRITASAPGKVILFGEHAVVYGKLGIAVAIDKRVMVSVEAGRSGIKVIQKPPYPTFTRSRAEVSNLLEIFRRLRKERAFDEIKKFNFLDALTVVLGEIASCYGWQPLQVRIEFEGSMKGLGGSAAIFSALTTAAVAARGKELTRAKINEFAYLGEIIAHGGTPSGIDNSTVTFGGYLKYTKARGPEPLGIDFIIPIVVVDSGEPAKTGVTVPCIRKQLETDPVRVSAILDNLQGISGSALLALKSKDLAAIGALMTDYYRELRKLNISTTKLDQIVSLALKAGALGAKPTGGWGGGVCIALARDGEHAEELIKIFNQHGFAAFTAKLGVPGVRLELR